MTVFETLTIMINFSVLIVAVLAVNNTKK
ncbi:putative holin-like toxin [Streptohalobacillus salinus]